MKQSYHFLLILFISCFTTKLYSQSVPSYVPTNGLVGWWGFNGNAQDGSGNGNHGIVNGATLTTDRFGNVSAFLFSNNTDNITIPNLYQNNILSYSTTGWFKKNQNQIGNGGGVILAGNIPLSTPAGLRFTIPGPHECTWQVEDGWNTNGVLGIDSNITYNDNEWHFFAAVFNTNPGLIEASAFKIYIDNQLILTRTFQQHWPPGSGFGMGFNVYAPIINNTIPVVIGNSNSFTAGFNGILDDISIYHRALTQQEITNLYNSQFPTQTSLCLPTITTNTPTSIGIDSVVIGGDILNDGGSSIVLRGVCYSTTPNPNMGNMRTEDGSGVGSFSTILRNLNPSTTYYVRSYAKNSNGVVVYGDEVSFSTTTNLFIGASHAGGIIFYLDSTGQHGLVCAPFDQGTYPWGCYATTSISNSSTGIGTGATNTSYIVNECSDRPIAASVCANLTLNGFSDWYLPSKDELVLMYNQLHILGLGGFANDWYWSSSQVYPQDAWLMFFGNGFIYHIFYRGVPYQVRAIRSF